MDHLKAESKIIALQSDKERCNYIDDRFWIPYPSAVKIINMFDDLLQRPKVDRMPNLLLYGDSNNGKSEILKEYDSRFNARIVPGSGAKLDVLLVQTPPQADESRLYTTILEKLNIAQSFNEKVNKKYYRVEQAFQSLEIKILILDEIHNIITGTFNKQRQYLTVMKFLANELKLVLIAAGTREARRVINTDEQLANRFRPVELPRWKLNEDYLKLLLSFEQRLPLKERSDLASRDIASKVFDMSEGLLGEISWILKEAAKIAISQGKEAISLSAIEALDYTPPSLRRKA